MGMFVIGVAVASLSTTRSWQPASSGQEKPSMALVAKRTSSVDGDADDDDDSDEGDDVQMLIISP